MRVLHGITRVGGAGAERQLKNLLLSGSRQDIQHRVFSLASGEFEQVLADAGVKVEVRPYGRQKLPLAALAIAKSVRANSIDLLQSWDPQFDVLMGLVAKVTGRPFIGSERNCAAQYSHPDGYGRAWFRRVRGPVLKRCASLVVANSKAGQDYILSVTGGRTRCIVIPNGVDMEDLIHRSTGDTEVVIPEERFIVTVNRLNAPKRTDVSIREFHLLVQQGYDERLLILGTGPQESLLRKLVNELELGERVTFLGYRENALAYVARATMLLSASSTEGTPNSVIEAMALGTPVVISNIEPHAELAQNSLRGAMLFDPDNPGDGSRAMASLLADIKTREQQILRAKTYTNGLTVERMRDAFNAAYLDVTGHQDSS